MQIWRQCWSFYILPVTSLVVGYRDKPKSMTVIQHLAFPFKLLSDGFKNWADKEVY